MWKNIFLISFLVFNWVSLFAEENPFAKANFSDLVILNQKGQDALGKKLKKIESPEVGLIQILEMESRSKIVSPIFELAQASSFKNLYVYIGQEDKGNYELVQAYQGKSGNIFVVDMDITKIEVKQLTLVHGPPNQLEIFFARRLNNQDLLGN